ncbi:MAG TPA: hypothetical protein VGJ22_05030 [Anaerolineales bacterium]|jgi:hypothetical protein
MAAPIILTSEDPVLKGIDFKPYRNKMVRRVAPFTPEPGEPQTRELTTPWGTQLTARPGDFLISELDNPDDVWPVTPDVFDESYMIIRPGYCVKRALTYLAPLVDVTGGDAEKMVTVETLEGPETVRAGDFYLARGVKGEIWPYPKEKIKEVMEPVD